MSTISTSRPWTLALVAALASAGADVVAQHVHVSQAWGAAVSAGLFLLAGRLSRSRRLLPFVVAAALHAAGDAAWLVAALHSARAAVENAAFDLAIDLLAASAGLRRSRPS